MFPAQSSGITISVNSFRLIQSKLFDSAIKFHRILIMLSTFDTNFQRVRDVEQFAIDSINRGGLHGDGMIGEAEYHCQGYAGEGIAPHDVMIGCRIKVNQAGKRRFTFTLNGRAIARHKITLRLGEMGV